MQKGESQNGGYKKLKGEKNKYRKINFLKIRHFAHIRVHVRG